MSTQAIPAKIAVHAADPRLLGRGHRIRVTIAAVLAVTLILSLAVNGFNYYRLPLKDRPFSLKHDQLKPSGTIGLKLGILGACMFCVIFLYAIRKRWPWLQRKGISRHWLDFHIVLGLSAPFVIAFHSSFKFRGFAGIAFWIMVAVASSGIIGRYLYAQIVGAAQSADLSLKQSRQLMEQIVKDLAQQKMFRATDIEALFWLPAEEYLARISALRSLWLMIMLDLERPWLVARLRRNAIPSGERIACLGGMLRTSHKSLERAIRIARSQAKISKRVQFLSVAQRIFHLWHVVHKPFSISFALLAIIHISVVILLGFA